MYRRESFCGPAGDGVISQFFSWMMGKVLKWMGLNFEKSCQNHDIDWDNGPNTKDDIKFALSVYEEAKEQQGSSVAWIASIFGFLLVRSTAIVYKLIG
ncbi:MAG: hypothetical protein E2O80_06340 [Betaproteobacteria bacterium]|jgi:hypothetical protein|nr:MAG: hypothetical protein E2O80_06340 [Betaproteobacteria bacterium]